MKKLIKPACLTIFPFMVKISKNQAKKAESNFIPTIRRISMIDMTDAAKTQIQEYFNGKEPTPIRIFLNSGG